MHAILLIDDNAGICALTAKLLESRFVVTVRDNALAIVEDFELLGAPVVVLDVSMPLMDGFQAARLLKSRYPNARIVFFSSHVDPDSMAAAMTAGGCAYVVKTQMCTDLIPAIEAACLNAADYSAS